MIVFEIGSLVVSITGFEIGSLSISTITVIVLGLAYWKIIQHNKLSIMPRLDTHIDTQTNTNTNTKTNQKTTKTIITSTLQNNGLGTVIIKKILLLVDNEETENEDPMNFIVEKIKANCSVKSNNITAFSLGERGRGLLSGESIILAKMEFQGVPTEEDEKKIARFDIEIYYESLDGKKYIYPPKEKTKKPIKPLKKCKQITKKQ